MNPILASKAKEICQKYFDWQLDNFPDDFDDWLATPEAAALLSGEDWKEDDGKFQEAVNLLQKMVTDTNPEQVMETYESIHVFLKSINQ